MDVDSISNQSLGVGGAGGDAEESRDGKEGKDHGQHPPAKRYQELVPLRMNAVDWRTRKSQYSTMIYIALLQFYIYNELTCVLFLPSRSSLEGSVIQISY
jgi:hypothetical protein